MAFLRAWDKIYGKPVRQTDGKPGWVAVWTVVLTRKRRKQQMNKTTSGIGTRINGIPSFWYWKWLISARVTQREEKMYPAFHLKEIVLWFRRCSIVIYMPCFFHGIIRHSKTYQRFVFFSYVFNVLPWKIK